MLLPLLSFPYLYGVLGEARFGALVSAQALSGLFAVVADFGFHAYLTRELPIRKAEEHASLAAEVQAARFVLSGILIVPYALVVLLIPAFRDSSGIFFASFLFVPANASIPIGAFQGIGRFSEINIIQSVQRIAFTLLIFALIHRPESDWYAPIIQACCAGWAGWWSWRRLRTYGFKRVQIRASALRIHLSRSSGLFWISAANSSLAQAPILMLGAASPASIVSQFAFVDKLLLVFRVGIQAMGTVLLPRLSALSEKQISALGRFRTRLVIAVVLYALAGFALWLAVDALSPWFEQVLGSEFSWMLRGALFIPPLFAARHLAEVFAIGRDRSKRYSLAAPIVALLQWLALMGLPRPLAWTWVLGSIYLAELALLWVALSARGEKPKIQGADVEPISAELNPLSP